MQEADVVLATQTDGAVKKRPAVVLREMLPYRDFLVCGISSQRHQYVEGFDELIEPHDADFDESGLLGASVIRLGFLAVIPRQQIVGSIGRISKARHERLLRCLGTYLMASLSA